MTWEWFAIRWWCLNDHYGFKCVKHSLEAAATHGAPNWAWARQQMEAHKTEGCENHGLTKAQKLARGIPQHDCYTWDWERN